MDASLLAVETEFNGFLEKDLRNTSDLVSTTIWTVDNTTSVSHHGKIFIFNLAENSKHVIFSIQAIYSVETKNSLKEIWGSQFLKKCSLSNFSLALLDFTCTMFFTQLLNQNDNRTPMMVTEEPQSMRTVLGRFECSFACRRLR